MKRVLVIVKTLSISGIGSVIFSYYNALNKNEIHMDFAAAEPIDDCYQQIIKAHNATLYILPDKNKNFIYYINKICKIVRNGKYEIVHVHGNSSFIIPDLMGAWLGGAPKRIAHSHNTTCNHPKISRAMRPIFNRMYNVALACGDAAGKWMFGSRDFIIIKNGVKLDEYIFSEEKRAIIREELGVGEELVIGHVGTFNYQKNQEFLIDVFAEYVKTNITTKLLLVGEGELLQNIKKKVEFYGLMNNVIFYGKSHNVLELMMAMDIFILPSRHEGLPCVLIEAQATGLPCIVSSKVSSEAKMSEDYKILKLDDGLNKWCKTIENLNLEHFRVNTSYLNRKRMRQKGYDINKSVLELEKIYGV